MLYFYDEYGLNNDFKSINNHYKNFLETFYKEYSDDIEVEFGEGGVLINNKALNENSLFLDQLMQSIKEIEDSNPRIDKIINADYYNKFLLKNPSLTKLDCYFYSILEELDKYLDHKNLQLINYMKWSKIFKNDKGAVFEDRKELFADLLENKEFISIVESYLTSKDNENAKLSKIMEMMNTSYKSNFKLEINFKKLTEEDLLGNVTEETIYLNIANNNEKLVALATLFHEYRHLIQAKEIKENTT